MPTLAGSNVLFAHHEAREHARTTASVLDPLKQGYFLLFMAGTFIGSLGARMHEIAAVWLMTELTTSPFMISLVTTAFSLPGFLLALPAGAIGDMFDRRRLLLFSQSMMATTIAVLALLVLKGRAGPGILLTETALCGLFATIATTTTDAIVPQIVKRREFSAAIALTGVRYHLSRALGPLLGGALVTAASLGHAFLVCAITPFAILLFLWVWHHSDRSADLPPEHLGAALRTGLRYVRYTPELTAVLVRLIAFVGVGSAMWALLPAYVRHHLGLDAFHYGMLFGVFGFGGVFGTTFAFRLNRTSSGESVMTAATVVFAVTLLLIAGMRSVPALAATLFLGGVGWSAGLVGLKTAIQVAAPDWVRARISAIHLLVLHGAVAVGSASWGALAWHLKTTTAMRYAGITMIATLVLAFRYRLAAVDAVNDEEHPAPRIPPLEIPAAAAQESAPLMISLEYRVDPNRAREFEDLMQEIGSIRRRVGATFWGLFSDLSVPGKYAEHFVVQCALDARSMHDRMTDPEREKMSLAQSFHTSGLRPQMRHQWMVCDTRD